MEWPTQFFYIVSQAQSQNQALAVDDNHTLQLRPLAGRFEELWKAEPDLVRSSAGKECARIVHLASRQALTLPALLPPLSLVPLPAVMKDIDHVDGRAQLFFTDHSSVAQGNWYLWRPWINKDYAVGRVDTMANQATAKESLLQAALDLKQRPQRPGETGNGFAWQCLPETGHVTLVSADYDLTHATADLAVVPPVETGTIDIDNTAGGATVTSTYQLQRSVSQQYSITNSTSDTTSQQYTQTFSVEGTIGEVVKVSASASFEESYSQSVSLTDEKGHATTNTDTVGVQVNVPPGKKYRYSLSVFYGKVQVPYSAKMAFRSAVPGLPPVPFTQTGVFEGVNATRTEIAVADVTSGKPVKLKSSPTVSIHGVS